MDASITAHLVGNTARGGVVVLFPTGCRARTRFTPQERWRPIAVDRQRLASTPTLLGSRRWASLWPGEGRKGPDKGLGSHGARAVGGRKGQPARASQTGLEQQVLGTWCGLALFPHSSIRP